MFISTPIQPADASVYRTLEGQRAMLAWYDACLAALPVTCDSRTVSTRHGDTHLLVCGPEDAPPLVLLHGTEGSALSWRHQLADLSAAHRVYALDIIGSAGKSAPTRPAYDGAGYAEWLADVLDALGLDAATFVGISNGCWLIFKLAALAPRRIRRAVLLSVNGMVPVRFPFHLARYRAADALRTVAADHLLTPALVRRAFVVSMPRGQQVDEHEVGWFYVLARHYRFKYPPGRLSDDDQRRLAAPAMLLMGERDLFFDRRAALAQARRVLPDLRRAEILPGVGHGMIIDRPALVNTRILSFLRETA